MLPRLAAMVCRATTGTALCSSPARESTSRAKGTKVMRETSLVTSMLKKKGRKISTHSSCRVVAVRAKSSPPIR